MLARICHDTQAGALAGNRHSVHVAPRMEEPRKGFVARRRA
jgi:hypothetical protein